MNLHKDHSHLFGSAEKLLAYRSKEFGESEVGIRFSREGRQVLRHERALSKNARFEQIWRSRKGRKEATHDDALHEICHVYDVVRVDVEETASEVQEQDFLVEIQLHLEYDVPSMLFCLQHQRMTLYDLYAVKDDANITEEDASNPFPLVQVEDDDEFDDGLDESEYESDDSNAEDNPLNDYPDEDTSEDNKDSGSRTSSDESEELDSANASDKYSKPKDLEYNWSEDANTFYEDDIYDDGEGGVAYCYDDDGGGDDDEWRSSYR
ncbi:hypothetical protein TEA_007558 [Camellia sinensis var. sinensis]|uniref:Transcription factor Iwr1 domain-containing protein n=1 Tax=Camellia sinensis var. sinensis TaxID=542762 RepID=A0A4S4D6I5_CAMSN|nr:hypothetical protein TEA_007558 [Camellia sinensis var. sinensis]